MISKDKKFLAAEEKLKWKNWAYSYLAKRLKDNEALSTRAMNKLNEKQKIIQDQAKLIKEKERKISAEGRNAKDKEKERAHAEMTQRLEESEALLTKYMNELS